MPSVRVLPELIDVFALSIATLRFETKVQGWVGRNREYVHDRKRETHVPIAV
jgi:hypothetical protein